MPLSPSPTKLTKNSSNSSLRNPPCNSHQSYKKSEETGTDFYNNGSVEAVSSSLNYQPITTAPFSNNNQNDESFSYEIEMQKEYVMRLKLQRQKIEALYNKYDVILSEIKKKDNQLSQKDQSILQLQNKTKDLQLRCQQMQLLREENKQIMGQNVALKHRVVNLQSESCEILEQIKLKDCLVSDQKEELIQLNDMMQNKIRGLNEKLLRCEEEYRMGVKVEKEKQQKLRMDGENQREKLMKEIGVLREDSIKKDEVLRMMQLEGEFLTQKMKDNEESYTHYLKELEQRIEKNQKEKKVQIKSLKEVIQQKNLELESLGLKLSTLKQQFSLKENELSDCKKVLLEEKRLFDEDVHLLKSQLSQEKTYFREQLMQCENCIERLEGRLSEGMKRESELKERLRRVEMNEAAKRNLRDIERQEMERIGRVLDGMC